VEVKLTDRAGELRIAVRTPDSHLAERLRTDLPALSSRLEESGFRAETWHPTSASQDGWHKPRELATATSTGQQEEPQQQQDRGQQRQDEPRRPQLPKEDEQPKEKRKDFEWFLSATQ